VDDVEESKQGMALFYECRHNSTDH